jgi:hypothetical protein
MKAWLVLWEWSDERLALEDEIAAILRPRMSSREVAKTMEFLYQQATSTALEWAAIAKVPRDTPNRAMLSDSFLHCGHNPYLVAYQAINLKIETDATTGIETISWTMPTLYRWNRETEQREFVRGPLERKVTRTIVGPLSHCTKS